MGIRLEGLKSIALTFANTQDTGRDEERRGGCRNSCSLNRPGTICSLLPPQGTKNHALIHVPSHAHIQYEYTA